MDLEQLTFAGRVDISLAVLREAPVIVLHAAPTLELEEQVQVDLVQGQQGAATADSWETVTNVTRDELLETVTLTLTRPLQPGLQYRLLFQRFQSNLSSDNFGFYRSSYFTADGQSRY